MYMMFIKRLFFVVLLVFASSASAYDYALLPEIVKTNIAKQYEGEDIKILSVRKMGAKFRIIIKTESGKDKVVVTKKGKILSISDYLAGMEPSGGC
ncbi:MAG: hypothetical protein QM482_06300 [Sulfurospirillum sp.]